MRFRAARDGMTDFGDVDATTNDLRSSVALPQSPSINSLQDHHRGAATCLELDIAPIISAKSEMLRISLFAEELRRPCGSINMAGLRHVPVRFGRAIPARGFLSS
jgi:hypothetical protein